MIRARVVLSLRRWGSVPRRVAAAIATLVVGVLAFVACSASGAATPSSSGAASGASAAATLTIGLTYTPNVQFAPFYVAEDQGFFKDAGVSVNLRHHGEAEELFGALKAGDEQLVYASGDEITQAVAAGTPLRGVATVYSKYPAALIVPADSPIRQPTDLRGHTIGVPGRFGQTWFALLALLQRAGLSEQDVRIETIGYTQQAALSSGRVDAVMGFVNNDAVQFEAAGLPVRTIDAIDPATPTLVGPAVAAATATLDTQPDAVRGVLLALARGVEFVRANPERAVEISAKYVPTLSNDEGRQGALATLQATLPLLAVASSGQPLRNDPSQWGAMAEFMREAGLIAREPQPQELFTNEFLPAASEVDAPSRSSAPEATP